MRKAERVNKAPGGRFPLYRGRGRETACNLCNGRILQIYSSLCKQLNSKVDIRDREAPRNVEFDEDGCVACQRVENEERDESIKKELVLAKAT